MHQFSWEYVCVCVCVCVCVLGGGVWEHMVQMGEQIE